jgi:hypothetical protein
LSVLLTPRFVHGGSNVLGGLKVHGGQPLDLLPSVFGASCTECDAVGALRGLQVTDPLSDEVSAAWPGVGVGNDEGELLTSVCAAAQHCTLHIIQSP